MAPRWTPDLQPMPAHPGIDLGGVASTCRVAGVSGADVPITVRANIGMLTKTIQACSVGESHDDKSDAGASMRIAEYPTTPEARPLVAIERESG